MSKLPLPTGSNIVWQNVLVDAGDVCGHQIFKEASYINSGNQKYLPPEISKSFDVYRNKWLCFRAYDRAEPEDFYYTVWKIPASRPVITILKQAPPHVLGPPTFLRAQSNKPVSYRVGVISDYPHKETLRFSNFYAGASMLAGFNDCEYMFYAHDNTDEDVFETVFNNVDSGKVAIRDYKSTDKVTIYCFEATDDYGNKVYLHVDNYNPIGEIEMTILGVSEDSVDARFRVRGKTGFVDWSIIASSRSTHCQSVFFEKDLFGEEIVQYRTRQDTRPYKDNIMTKGLFYCVKIKDHFGNRHAKVFYIPTHFVKGSITLTQTQDKVVASGFGLKDFAYFIQVVEPRCDAAAIDIWVAGQSQRVANNAWICFRATNYFRSTCLC